MTHRGPFQPLPCWDSVIRIHPCRRCIGSAEKWLLSQRRGGLWSQLYAEMEQGGSEAVEAPPPQRCERGAGPGAWRQGRRGAVPEVVWAEKGGIQT